LPRTIGSLCFALKALFKYSALRGWSSPNISRGIRAPRILRYSHSKQILPWKHVRILLSPEVSESAAGLARRAFAAADEAARIPGRTVAGRPGYRARRGEPEGLRAGHARPLQPGAGPRQIRRGRASAAAGSAGHLLLDCSGTEGSFNTLAVAVDAKSGLYMQSAVHANPEGNLLRFGSAEEVAKSIIGTVVELPNGGVRIPVRREALCQYPRLVWMPCRESLSPMYPFHMFTIGSERIYVRTDGGIFTSLHTGDRGI